jgi:hypothetical protein
MGEKPRVLYLQLPVMDFGQDYWGADHPLAGGYLAAYALSLGVRHEPLFLPPSLTSAASVPALAHWAVGLKPQVIVATLYLWNVERTIRLVNLLKEALPGLQALAGGPETAGDFQSRFPRHPFDWVHDGEGEGAFAAVLDHILRHGAKAREPLLAAAAGAPGLVSLEKIPSPYLTDLLPLAPDGSAWVETMRGCPFGCAYCYYGKSFPEMRWFPEKWLEDHLAWAHGQKASEIYLLDPSFQISPGLEERLRRIAQWNRPAIPLHTEARVDRMTPQLAAGFARAGFRSMETGLQSIHAHVLKTIRRAGDAEKFSRGARMLLDQAIRIQTDVILGLPRDTPQGFLATVEFLARENLKEGVAVYPLLGLPGTALREKAREWGIRFRGRPPYQVESTPFFGPESLRAAVEEAERILDLGLYPVHLPDLTPREGPHELVGVVEVDLGRHGPVGLDTETVHRLIQCPVILFEWKGSSPPWDRIRAWGAWQKELLPHILPFWGLRAESKFSVFQLEKTLGALHDPDSYQAGVWSLCPDPYLRLSCRPFVLSSCPGDPGFWKELHEILPVIRITSGPPVPEQAPFLKRLPVLWDTPKVLGRRILSALAPAFAGREEELLFSCRENGQSWAALTGLPLPPRGLAMGRIRVP